MRVLNLSLLVLCRGIVLFGNAELKCSVIEPNSKSAAVGG